MSFIRNQKGFTLVELLIVVVIIGILAGLAVPKFLSNQQNAQAQTCRGNLHMLENAIESFNADQNGYPAALANLTAAGTTYIRRVPTCPRDKAAYTYTAATGNVACTNFAAATPAHAI